MERYYNAGYYLIKKCPIQAGNYKGKIVSTCSGCINATAFDLWSLSNINPQLDESEKEELGLSNEKITQIQKWADKRLNDEILGFGNVFPNLMMAKEFKDLFYKDNLDIEIYSIEFSEIETNFLIGDFEPGKNSEFNFNDGYFGLRDNLLKKVPEVDKSMSEFCGYDLIGVECDGSFHSFHCHDIADDLVDKFGLKLNKQGLFESIINEDSIRDYLNDPKTGLGPVPWYIVKVKRILDASS